MPKTGLFILFLTLALIGCGGSDGSDADMDPAEAEASFDAFARSLYAELERRPLSDTMEVDIGLFGDLNVMAGENVVMGRYRYRVDEEAGAPAGRLSFLVRRGQMPGIPIVLQFEAERGSWNLRDARVAGSASDAPASAVEALLDRRLEGWTQEAMRAIP